MNISHTDLPGILILDPPVFHDDRGCFLEVFQKERYQAAGLELEFVQDNCSFSRQGTLRGLHYQLPRPQGKLIWVIHGVILDVAVDLRRGSSTFGRWTGIQLSDENRRQVYVPPGFAHGFCVVSEFADVMYKCTDYYDPRAQHTLRWDDPQLAISWPVSAPRVSAQDRQGRRFSEAICFD